MVLPDLPFRMPWRGLCCCLIAGLVGALTARVALAFFFAWHVPRFAFVQLRLVPIAATSEFPRMYSYLALTTGMAVMTLLLWTFLRRDNRIWFSLPLSCLLNPLAIDTHFTFPTLSLFFNDLVRGLGQFIVPVTGPVWVVGRTVSFMTSMLACTIAYGYLSYALLWPRPTSLWRVLSVLWLNLIVLGSLITGQSFGILFGDFYGGNVVGCLLPMAFWAGLPWLIAEARGDQAYPAPGQREAPTPTTTHEPLS